MKHLVNSFLVLALVAFIGACKEGASTMFDLMEKEKQHENARTKSVNLHVTATTNVSSSIGYDTIFIYNGGTLNVLNGAYVTASAYIPKVTGTTQAIININSGATLRLSQVLNFGNTNLTNNGTFHQSYLVSSHSSAVFTNYGYHGCPMGTGMIWATGNYHNYGRVYFFDPSTYNTPWIRFNGGNFWMYPCSRVDVNVLINNQNSVVKGTGRVAVSWANYFNAPFTTYSTIKLCPIGSPSNTGAATIECGFGCP